MITGVEALNKKLAGLSHDVRYKGGRFALRKAANVIAEAVKTNADKVDDPKTSESIKKNVAIRWSSKRFKSTGDLAFRVGILGGARAGGASNPGGETFHWRFLEFGTEKMRANPFMQKSIDQSKMPAVNQFILHYNKALDRAIKRLKK